MIRSIECTFKKQYSKQSGIEHKSQYVNVLWLLGLGHSQFSGRPSERVGLQSPENCEGSSSGSVVRSFRPTTVQRHSHSFRILKDVILFVAATSQLFHFLPLLRLHCDSPFLRRLRRTTSRSYFYWACELLFFSFLP